MKELNFLTGRIGEEIALKYLKENNYKIIERNFRHKKLGEIDIIAEDKNVLVFIEVKTRKSEKYGSPLEAVNTCKQKKIKKMAEYYLTYKKIKEKNCRMDVLTITLDKENKVKNINLVKNAIF